MVALGRRPIDPGVKKIEPRTEKITAADLDRVGSMAGSARPAAGYAIPYLTVSLRVTFPGGLRPGFTGLTSGFDLVPLQLCLLPTYLPTYLFISAAR